VVCICNGHNQLTVRRTFRADLGIPCCPGGRCNSDRQRNGNRRCDGSSFAMPGGTPASDWPRIRPGRMSSLVLLARHVDDFFHWARRLTYRTFSSNSPEMGAIRLTPLPTLVWMTTNAKPSALRDSTPRTRGNRGDKPCPIGTLARQLGHRTRPTGVSSFQPAVGTKVITRRLPVSLPCSVVTGQTRCATC